MSDTKRTQQIARIQNGFDEIGKEVARRIMGQCVADFLPVDQMRILVEQECEVMRRRLVACGGSPSDIKLTIDGIRLAIVREGRRIAEGLDVEGGRA